MSNGYKMLFVEEDLIIQPPCLHLDLFLPKGL